MKLMTKYACLALLSCSCSLLAGTLVDLGPLVKPVELLDDGSVVALDMNDKVPFKWSNGQRVDMPDLVNTGSGLPVMAKDATPVERSVKAANGNLQVGWVNDVNMEVQPGPTKRAAVWRGTSVSLLSDAGFGGCANGRHVRLCPVSSVRALGFRQIPRAEARSGSGQAPQRPHARRERASGPRGRIAAHRSPCARTRGPRRHGVGAAGRDPF